MRRPVRSLLPAVLALVAVGLGAARFAAPAGAGRASWNVGHAISVTRSTNSKSTPTSTSTPRPTPTSTPKSTVTPPAPFLGTLVTRPTTAVQESKAGIKMGMVELAWRDFEPAAGVFNLSYARSMAARVTALQNAGMRVTLSLGLHYTPSWVLARSDSRMVDQYGHVSSGADLIFNQNIRNLAAAYIAKVAQTMDMSSIYAVRITSGVLSEMQYPGGGSYWAFSSSAQNGASKATTLAKNPLPGFKPSVTKPRPSAAAISAWEQWYVGALADVADWQMSQLSAVGYSGYFQVVTPGQGVRPVQLPALLTAGLPDGLIGRGAVWYQLYADLKVRKNVTAYVSSVADGSANDNVCQPADAAVPLTSQAVFQWSAARWIARIAAVNGFSVAGENPGYPATASATAKHYRDTSSGGMMARAMAQATGCGFLGLYWAHDDQVWDGTISLSALARYTSPMAKLPNLAG